MPETENNTYQVKVKDGKSCEKVLNIQVQEEAIQQEYDAFYRSVAPKAKIPGFRPGKAPRKVLAQHFAQEAREEVMKHLVSSAYRWALDQNSIEPLNMPLIEDVDFKDEKLSFVARVEVRPTIKLGKVEGLSAKKEKIDVKASEIEDSLKQLQNGHAQFKAVEDRAVQMGDYVIADYVCHVDGKEIDKRQDDWLEVKEDEFLKGFTKQLVGAKPGESRDIEIEFPKDMGRDELKGKKGIFKVDIKEIKVKELPPIDDDLAKESGAGDCNTLAELKEKIKADIQASRESEKEMEYEKALLKELVKNNKIDLPARLVQSRVEYLFEQAKQQAMSQGSTEEQFEEHKGKMEKNFNEEAKYQVHLAFLLDEIAKQKEVVVVDKDVDDKLQQTADRFKRPLEEIKQYYQNNPESLQNLKDQIRSEKTINLIKETAKQK